MTFGGISKSNVITAIVAFINFIVASWLFVNYPPLRSAGGIYALLAFVGMFAYLIPNPDIQEKLKGYGNLAKGFLSGIGLALFIIVLTSIVPGLAIGIPELPFSIGGTIRALIILGLAPLVEEILTRGVLLGYLDFFESQGGEVSTTEFWVANTVQAVFFMLLHALAYTQGWYSAGTFGQALVGLTAISGSLIAALIFGLLAGWVNWKFDSLIPSTTAHFLLNLILFTKLTVVGI